jgi:hypothetical protein
MWLAPLWEIEGETGYIGKEPTVTLYTANACATTPTDSQTYYLCLGWSNSVGSSLEHLG